MINRVEWLRFQVHYGQTRALPLKLLLFLTFEVYYVLCRLRGYRPRHVFLESLPERLRVRPSGERRILLIWRRLPLPIRVLERTWPCAKYSHAEFFPYNVETEAAARASGRRTAIIEYTEGQLIHKA